MLSVISNTELIEAFIAVIVFVDLKIRLYLFQTTVVYKTKKLAKITKPQNCVQMLLFCMNTNLVMGAAIIAIFNVQAILIIACTLLLSALRLPVMASRGVKNPVLAPLKSSHIMTIEPSFLAIVHMRGFHAAIAGKGMAPNSTTFNAQSLSTEPLMTLATLVLIVWT